MFSIKYDSDMPSLHSVSGTSESSCDAPSPLESVFNQVFRPVYHLQDDEGYFRNNLKNDHALARALHAAVGAYKERIDHAHQHQWPRITEMLENLQAIIESAWNGRFDRDQIISQLHGMKNGDMLALPEYGHWVLFGKQEHCTLFESFGVFHRVATISHPEPAIEIPNQVFDDEDFQSRIADCLAGTRVESLANMLGDVGHRVAHKCITKSNSTGSELWFLIKVTIRSILDRAPLGHGAYKTFMLFFICDLAKYAVNPTLSGFLLHSMSAKILRRLRKLGSSVPQWLCDAALHTCTTLSRNLDLRRQEVQAAQRSSLPWDPSQLDLRKDIQPSLSHTHEYISVSLANRGSDLPHRPFLPNSRFRGTLNDFFTDPANFLSTAFLKGRHDALYDVERAIGEGIDDWVACATNVDKACEQLHHLVHQYHSVMEDTYRHKAYAFGRSHNHNHFSIMLLTIIELWVALDKLVVKEIPILADYSPEIPIGITRGLLLRDAISIHRLCRACQYLFVRHTRAHPRWSVLSDEFTEHSFPCRFYDSSPHLQRLKARIEYSLPTDPLNAKVVVFELQCPVFFDTWRSVTCLISSSSVLRKGRHEKDIQIRDIPALKPHRTLSHSRSLSLYSSPAPQYWDTLYYVYEGSLLDRFEHVYKLSSGPYADSGLQRYLDNTKHTSNEVLAAQANCHPDLSLDEFIAFGHLRSGGSLQWFNILRELRNRTLDFRHQEVYLLLAQASTEVGPLDSTGGLLWHQELQNSSFCHQLLCELETLFVDVGAGSLDGPVMAIISLLAGILASKSFGDVSERAFDLLENVRRKTFEWVHELLYDLGGSPTNKESLAHLRDMAAVCRSTFDVGSAASHMLLRSVQDVEIALSCAMLIRIADFLVRSYEQLLLDRDHRLSIVLEGSLRDAIQADASDLGVDRAVQLVWPGYRPSPRRWEPLPSPNSRWLVCETAPTKSRRSRTVHVNLLDGSLLVDGRPIGNELPSAVTRDSTYQELFGYRNLMVVASDLPGMDFVTVSVIHKHHVHFAVRNDNDASKSKQRKIVVIRAQSKDDIFELIPRKKLQGDLPKPLIEDHIHWLNSSTSIIEIRPIKKTWEQSSDNWSIHLRSGQSHVIKGGELLVDKQSPTWAMVSGRLRCLDNPENLIITASPIDTTQTPSSLRLSVILPRYGLSFFVNDDGHLESRDLKNMVYDEDQCIGTLFGLVNRLVLRPKAQIEANLIPKCVLIPHSDTLVQRGHKVSDQLFPFASVMHYYTYQVDSELGCLKGIGSLDSRLYLARLHFLTGGGCRPDSLTGRTGVEEALSLLWLAGTRQGLAGAQLTEPCSPQTHFALEKLQDGRTFKRELFTEEDNALVRDAYQFPTEIAASVDLPKKGSLDSLDQLLHKRPAPNLRERNRLPRHNPGCHGISSPNIDQLRQLFSSLRINETEPPFQSEYISRLHRSAHHFRTTDPIGVNGSGKPSTETLRKHYVQCRINYAESLDIVKMALRPKTEVEQVLDQCGQWPRVTPFILFRCLASTSLVKVPESWKKCLIRLALLALDLQRARRLLQFALDNLEEELYKELENDGWDGWAAEHPDWLLIQLQGNFLIRRVQADVAKEMMSPRSGKNTVVQVNMGEGKTSVVIPICAAALADGNQLVRVVVPKALIPQTLQVLTDRLSGLVDRPIYHLTFSRDDANVEIHHQDDDAVGINRARLFSLLDTGASERGDTGNAVNKVEHLRKLAAECTNERGILVMQPEDVLSLKLACVEMQLPKNVTRTNSTPIVQKWGFDHVLHVLTGSFKSLTKGTEVSRMIGRVKRWCCEPETIEKPWDVELADRALTSQQAADLNVVVRLLGARELARGRKLAERSRQANLLVELQGFLETHTRDILDESDDVLRPQFRLIYAIGRQQPFEGSPDRWIIVQQVLGLVKQHACLLSAPNSHTIWCDDSPPGSFPHIHILQAEGGKKLISSIVPDVLDGHLSALSFHSELGLMGAIRDFISRKDIHADTVKMVENYARQGTSWSLLLLLRGLFAHNMLLFALAQRRWRVDYGLDPTSSPRTMLAIPYRAKDVPTKTAEFGHPDITILLTCLSYYYGGLSEAQLRISFELLLQQDDPSSEYALWVEDYGTASVPNFLRHLNGVNIRSLEQWDKYLVPLFTRNKRAIDLYLSKVVFAKYAKEFPWKISGSYWDLAEQKNHLVTGFSGTNDGQYLLPTSIVQDDPDHLHQTGANARILTYLLQPENSSYMATTDENGERWTTLKLLSTIVAQDPQIRVLLDVGAQILDLTNLELAKAWLDLTPATEIAGAIYFNEDDKLMVLARNGSTDPLSSLPLIQQLHRCVVYLDDAHTRGTDLKFPLGFRAAVTLGHKVTKDRLAQGCMRMRKLGHGHSVMFFAPHEVDQRIRGLVAKENPIIPVTTADILHWAIHETWSDIQRQAPYWAQQGMSHQSRHEAWSRFRQNTATPEQLADVWVQPEVKSLADMYMPCHSPDTTSSTKLPRQIRDRCENLGVLSLPDVRIDEEQEREVSREIEREREIERRPHRASPAAHFLHSDVINFVRTGVVPSPSWSAAFRHVFATSVSNSIATSSALHAWSPYILATEDFRETVQESESVQGRMNDYLRHHEFNETLR